MNGNWNRNAPIDRQLRDRAVVMILEGSLGPGDALPAVTGAAAELQVNPLTVARAYRQLVAEEVAEDRSGIGLVITRDAPERLRRTERERFLREKWPKILKCMSRLGFDAASLQRFVTRHQPA